MKISTFYTSVLYRQRNSILSRDRLFHKGINATAGLTKFNLKLTNNKNGNIIVELPLDKVDLIVMGKGIIRIQYLGQNHVLDFFSPFHKSLISKNNSSDRAIELAHKIQELGIKINIKSYFK